MLAAKGQLPEQRALRRSGHRSDGSNDELRPVELAGVPRLHCCGGFPAASHDRPQVLFPVPQEGQEIWHTPMFFSDIWQLRIAAERIKILGVQEKGDAS